MNREAAKKAIRKLRDHDQFESQIVGDIDTYIYARHLGSSETSRRDRKEAYDRVINTLSTHIQAINRVPDDCGIGYQSRYLDELQGMREHWTAHREKLDRIEGRGTQHLLLDWLVENLSERFETWRVPAKNLSGFLKSTLPDVLPEKQVPSDSAIEKAINSHRK